MSDKLYSAYSIHLNHSPSYATYREMAEHNVCSVSIAAEGGHPSQLTMFFPLSQRDRAGTIAALLNEMASFFPEEKSEAA